MAMTPEERRARSREWMRAKRAADPEWDREHGRRYRERNGDAIRQRAAANREKNNEQARLYSRAYPEKRRAAKAKHRHGTDFAQLLTAMREAQDDLCYLCGDPLPTDSRHVHIDHDHRCCPKGRSCRYCRRGLACSSCNVLIGFAGDDPVRLRRIAGNLEAALAAAVERIGSKPQQLDLG